MRAFLLTAALALGLPLACSPKNSAAPPPAPEGADAEVVRGAPPAGRDARLHGADNYKGAEKRTVEVSGLVRDSVSSRSVADVHVRLVSTEPDGRSYAAVTDPTGVWRIPEVPVGSYAIEVSAYGYKPHKDWMALASSGEPVHLPIDIDPEGVRAGYSPFQPLEEDDFPPGFEHLDRRQAPDE